MATEVVGAQSTKSGKGKRQYALGLKRHFTKKGKHPYDLIEWERFGRCGCTRSNRNRTD